jgi:hypothetical protein
MSVIGIDPKRDNRAKFIIYGCSTALHSALSFIAVSLGASHSVGPGTSKYNREAQNRAWKIYSRTGSISEALKAFISNDAK